MAATNRLQDPGAAALMAIFCAVGAVLGLALTIVDYLPSSRTLLEVRDAEGRVLWSRVEGVRATA